MPSSTKKAKSPKKAKPPQKTKPPKKAPRSKKTKQQRPAEIQIQKSPAEFFAEHQAIAGFDNLGKSLYTSIRELVENALDACEAIHVLPEISVFIEEYTTDEFNGLVASKSKSLSTTAAAWSPTAAQPSDVDLFQRRKGRKSTSASKKIEMNDNADKNGETAPPPAKKPRRSQDAYFRLVVQDNGCGMQHDAIPNLLGRVLSGSKYGVRQTRGKFGLGAKMALIWSKKSTGQPIRLQTAHRTSETAQPSHYSTCVLDIDITKNEPILIEHSRKSNSINVRGTRMELLIAGNWTTYRARILQYIQQLAIITPYAQLSLEYENHIDPKRNCSVQYKRRSEQMPPPAATVKHHPSSVNNIIIQQLLQHTKAKTIVNFLSNELASVSVPLAKRLVQELAASSRSLTTLIKVDTPPSVLSDQQVCTRLVQLLKRVEIFKPPDGNALSPLGEYNLNLGIQFVQQPDYVATYRDRPGTYEGHSFLLEAAVSLGSKAKNNNHSLKEGITVVRFANRIPLLFESGADVVTRVANSKINWNSYKIDAKRDKIGVYVSIVSTKIPFKGTSKEYIGDDATPIQVSVKRALQACCQQLKVQLVKKHAWKEAQERSSRLRKYIPDVSRALFGLLDGMRERHEQSSSPSVPGARRIMDQMARGSVSEAAFSKALHETVKDQQQRLHDENEESGADQKNRVPVFLTPLYNLDDPQYDVQYQSLFTFRPLRPIPTLPAVVSASSSSSSPASNG